MLVLVFILLIPLVVGSWCSEKYFRPKVVSGGAVR